MSKKDLNMKIEGHEQSIWSNVIKNCKQQIESMEKELIVQKEILKLAEQKGEEEKKKFEQETKENNK